MEQLRFKRILKLRDLEIIKVREGFYGKAICYMLIVDYRRPCNINDFPELNLETDYDELNFVRSNFIKVIVVSNKKLSKKISQEVVYIGESLGEIQGDSGFSCSFEVIDKKEFKDLNYSNESILSNFQNLLVKHNFKTSLSDIDPKKFDYLSQE